MYEIKQYKTSEGRIVFRDWYGKLRDLKAKLAIDRRLGRLVRATSEIIRSVARVFGS